MFWKYEIMVFGLFRFGQPFAWTASSQLTVNGLNAVFCNLWKVSTCLNSVC